MKSVWQREVERAAESYRREAGQRRRHSPHDPVADTLEFVANDLIERARLLSDPTTLRSIEAYAAEHQVSAQTVRNWIRAGKLEAVPRGRTFLIPAGVTPPQGGRHAA